MVRARVPSWSLTAVLLLCVGAVGLAEEAERRPAVLFVRGVHSRYVVQPLHELGIAVDACKADELAERLATGRYNVVVAGTLDDAGRKAVDAFLARGGGALVCNPEAWSETARWTATNQWLARHGARPRWEVLQDSDPGNVVKDVMGCRLSWSDRVAPPADEGVRGVLTLLWHGTTGCEPPMSFDIGPAWKPVVRGSESLQFVPSKRHDEHLQPWKPAGPPEGAPVLMALRQAGKGRLAVLGVRRYWLFAPPSNCPTTEAMLTAGAGGKPSDWLRVCANAFRWLARPSLDAGMGGAATPQDLLHPPVQVWQKRPLMEWGERKPPGDQPQTAGLVGARTALSSGSGTVADYAAAARAAGLQFIVFLEDSLAMDGAGWEKLVAACEAASDQGFAAVPGLTYEDAQGNHLYAFADNVKFPQPGMLLADGRLATTQTMRSRALFDYVNEAMRQKIISGYWRHGENVLHVADYKLYNSFPIVAFVDGEAVDAWEPGIAAYRYLMSIGGCQAPLAFEIMTAPDQVAERAREGWRVVAHRGPSELRGKWHHGAWSFSGSGSQYVTRGPRILAWQGPNRLTFPRGEWWRPDLWEFRVAFRAAAEAGLRTVTLYDGQDVFRRWLPDGARTFEKTLVLANCQQRGLYLEVEDVRGRKAVNAEFWNRNLVMEEFFCSDRCNFLGSCRLRTKDGRQVWTQVSFKGNMGITPSKGRLDLGVQPAVCLTTDSPTLPIDGRPMGFPTVALRFRVEPPGELDTLFAYPVTALVSPEIAIGQADYRLGYDPAEKGAEKTRLGHPYEQPQHGWGNSWGSWHRLVPAQVLDGWSRTYACNWLTQGFRIGWHETDAPLKKAVSLGQEGLPVMDASMPGWRVYRGGKLVASPDAPSAAGAFERGTFATYGDRGGSVVVAALDGPLRYSLRKGRLALHYVPGQRELAAGERIRFRVGFAGAGYGTTEADTVDFAHKFAVARPGQPGYAAEVTRGKVLDTALVWRLEAEDGAIEAKVPKTPMPGFLPLCLEGLNDHWSVVLLDRGREGPNFRSLPRREGRAWAQLDLTEGDLDLFVGHPVVCDQPRVRLLVAWQQPGVWFLEAHNPTDQPFETTLETNEGWDLFDFTQRVRLAPGTSRTWEVEARRVVGR
ncbi:MAG: hypothetical protein ACLF0G_10390 [Candidatus Brocadiia bacterium]